MIDPNPFPTVGVQPGAIITGIVGGFTEDGEDFVLNFGGGSAIVDPSPIRASGLDLTVGESVSVLVDEFDKGEIDTRSIARPDGSMILDPVTGESLTGEIYRTSDPLTSPGNRTFSTSTISGQVIRIVNNDEFLLQTNNGPILVDADLPDSQSLNLQPGERVNVVGEFDDGDFDASAITRPDGSPIISTDTPAPANTISGQVIRMVDNDEFLLRTSNGRVLVDADLPDNQSFNLRRGERVNVVGEFDDGDFDASAVTRPDGSPIVPTTDAPGTATTISGRVIRMVDNDEFLLRTRNGRVRVDADLPDNQSLNLRRGERVNVVGEFDDDDFDASAITRPNGSPIL
ncbi:MAG: hypothetical protein AB4352_00545 [Hormoscilla sp.]